MSFVKTTFVKPLRENTDFGNFQKGSSQGYLYKENKDYTGIHGKLSANITALEEDQSKQILKFESVYAKCHADFEEIQKWKTLVEMDSKQKNKKIESLVKTIEGQRKSAINLQLLNENLNLQLAEENQQRSLVLEKLHSTKEMCSALKKHFSTLQGYLEYRFKIEDMISSAENKRLFDIDNLKNKLDNICVENSEKVKYLTNTLNSERNEHLKLRERYEQQLCEAENEREALCAMVKSYEKEIEKLSQLLDSEKNKSNSLDHEKMDLKSTILQLEKSKEDYSILLKEKEEALNILEISKQDLERQFLNVCSQNKDLEEKYKKHLEASELSKIEINETVLNLQLNKEQSNYKITDLEKKLKEIEMEKEELIFSLQTIVKEKCDREAEILEIESKFEAFEILEVDYNKLKESHELVMKEKNYILEELETCKNNLIECKNDKERFSVECDEKSKEVHLIKEEFQSILAIEADKLTSKTNEYDLLLLKLKDTENVLAEHSKIISVKEEEILQFQALINKKETDMEILQYENIEMKDKIQAELESVKICLECEQLKEKSTEVEVLKEELQKKEEENVRQDKNLRELLILLQDTEANYNADRLSKASEILNYQEQIRQLENNVRFLKCEQEELKIQTTENSKLKENIMLQNMKISEQLNKVKDMENTLQEKDKKKKEIELEVETLINKVKELENKLQEKYIKNKKETDFEGEKFNELKAPEKKFQKKGKKKMETTFRRKTLEKVKVLENKLPEKSKKKKETEFEKESRFVPDVNNYKTSSNEEIMDMQANKFKESDSSESTIYNSDKESNSSEEFKTKVFKYDKVIELPKLEKRENINENYRTVESKPPPLVIKRKKDNQAFAQNRFVSNTNYLKNGKEEVIDMHTDKFKKSDSKMICNSDQESNSSENFKSQECKNENKSFDDKNRKWEEDSSGSECLQLVMDETTNKIVGLTKLSNRENRNEVSRNIETKASPLITKRMRDNQSFKQEDLVRQKLGLPLRMRKFESSKTFSLQQLHTPNKNNSFANFKEKEKYRDSPWMAQASLKTAPMETTPRKFFKNNLEQRSTFKKPAAHTPWF